ncbi:MAG: phosphatidate cytidylyltransferase [Hydrogenibacillus sp.]|nr:phosphatidate cytidylyltransferase [Hydrogenibacillus sp.]
MGKRIATGVIGGGLFIGLTALGGIFFSVLVATIGLGTFYEYVKMHRDRPLSSHALLGFGLTFVLIFFTLSEIKQWFQLDLLWLVTFLLLFIAVITKNRVSLKRLSYILIGAVYIGLGFHYFVAVRTMENGLVLTFLVIAVVWATDSGAYFIGRLWGKRPLWPSISPNKTWEGAIGGLFTGSLAGLFVAVLGGLSFRPTSLIATVAVVSLGAQIGDLIESAIKRSLGVKDSGGILPGHGGFFDRFDSMIVAFPAFLWAARWFAPFV